MIDSSISNLNIKKFNLSSILPDSTILCIGRRRCFIENTELLCYNGDPIKIQDIDKNTLIMGDNSLPRKILQKSSFDDISYHISNKYNDEYYVNSQHILCLQYFKKKSIKHLPLKKCFVIKWFDNNKIQQFTKFFYYNDNNFYNIKSKSLFFYDKCNENLFVNIPVSQFLSLSKKLQNRLYGYRSLVFFNHININLTPYIYSYLFLFTFNKLYYFNCNIPTYFYKQFDINHLNNYITNTINIRLDFLNSLYLHSFSSDKVLKLYIPYIYFKRIIFMIHSLALNIKYNYNHDSNIGFIYFYIEFPIRDISYQSSFKLSIKQKSLSKFYSITVSNNNKFLLYNTHVVHNSGKSWLIRDIFYHKKSIPYGIVFSSSEQASPFFSNFIPDTFIYSDFDSEKINKLFIKQSEKISYYREKGIGNNGKTDENNVFIVLDDMLHNANVWKRDDNMKNIIFNGRHYNILSILTTQYAQSIPADFRGNMDYVFIFNEPSITNRRKIYEAYASCIPSFDGFCNILDRCTEDHSCLVVKTFSSTNNIEDQVFWYKAENQSNFKVGDPRFWSFHFSNYNITHDKNHIAQAKQVAKYREKFKNNNKLKYVVNKYDDDTSF